MGFNTFSGHSRALMSTVPILSDFSSTYGLQATSTITTPWVPSRPPKLCPYEEDLFYGLAAHLPQSPTFGIPPTRKTLGPPDDFRMMSSAFPMASGPCSSYDTHATLSISLPWVPSTSPSECPTQQDLFYGILVSLPQSPFMWYVSFLFFYSFFVSFLFSFFTSPIFPPPGERDIYSSATPSAKDQQSF